MAENGKKTSDAAYLEFFYYCRSKQKKEGESGINDKTTGYQHNLNASGNFRLLPLYFPRPHTPFETQS